MSVIREEKLRSACRILGKRIRARRKDLRLAQSANAYLCSDQVMQDLRDNLARIEADNELKARSIVALQGALDQLQAERDALIAAAFEDAALWSKERDALRTALVRACDYVETISGACPFDAVAGYECPHQEDCGNEMATCWREHFLNRKALGLESEGRNERD